MSATIGNVADLCRFLDAEIYTQNFRPVELIEYVKCGPEIAKIDWSKSEEDLLTVVRRVDFGVSFFSPIRCFVMIFLSTKHPRRTIVRYNLTISGI